MLIPLQEIKEILLRLLIHFEFSLPDDPEEREVQGWNRMLTKPLYVDRPSSREALLTLPSVKREGKGAPPRLPIKITPLQAVRVE